MVGPLRTQSVEQGVAKLCSKWIVNNSNNLHKALALLHELKMWNDAKTVLSLRGARFECSYSFHEEQRFAFPVSQ